MCFYIGMVITYYTIYLVVGTHIHTCISYIRVYPLVCTFFLFFFFTVTVVHYVLLFRFENILTERWIFIPFIIIMCAAYTLLQVSKTFDIVYEFLSSPPPHRWRFVIHHIIEAYTHPCRVHVDRTEFKPGKYKYCIVCV